MRVPVLKCSFYLLNRNNFQTPSVSLSKKNRFLLKENLCSFASLLEIPAAVHWKTTCAATLTYMVMTDTAALHTRACARCMCRLA